MLKEITKALPFGAGRHNRLHREVQSFLYNVQMIGIIYKYTSPSGKVYIGQTIDEKKRRKEFRNLNIKYAGRKINHARKKYGPENFEYEVLERYRFRVMERARKKLNERERYFIELYDSYRNGYNSDTGGWDASGFKWSEETKAEFRKKKKDKPNPFLGKHHTDETRAILSEKAKQSYVNGRVPNFKGRHHTEEAKRKNSEAHKALYANGATPTMLGKHHTLAARLIQSVKAQERMADPIFREKFRTICASEEHRNNLSKALRGEKNPMFGKKATPEARAKMSAARKREGDHNYKKQLAETQKEKLSDSLREYYRTHTVSEETRRKMREGQRTPIRQLTLDGEFVAEYPSPTIAQEKTGINSSYIVKVCRGKRPAANGYKWEYVETPENMKSIDTEIWIGTGEAVKLCGRHRNVLKYHMDVIKDLPFKKIGRKRLVHKPTLIQLYNIAS